ncbi:hypothetical protein OH540_21330 [Streptomyces sp. BPPL-273]|uniref:hypothetical protein n=1 Tax=Streptomyces TaxID=1883 RepID=UPI0024AEE509|nr:hypothetical protein [Streptomyces sp. BPPL-273]WHM32448.1 hypothetical protein OH540_21330 [Streptomyces sp. BPPL-273]
MARVRFTGPEPVTVPELGERLVHPDEIVEVPDSRYDGYVCQAATWEAVEEPQDRAAAVPPEDEAAPLPLRKAAKPQKTEG